MISEVISVRVANRLEMADRIAGFDLVALDGDALPRFGAGAHIDVHLPGGVIRQYSLWNDPAETDLYRIGVLREEEGRGGSQAMHSLQIGDTVQIGAPRNTFPLAQTATASVLLAGGIGITPLLSMAQALHASGQAFKLHYCARGKTRMAFRQWLADCAFADSVHMHFDDGPAAQRFDFDSLRTPPAAGTHLYVCGPSGFMDAAISAASGAWPSEAIHSEYFSAAPTTPMTEERAFHVRVGHDGPEVLVPGDRSIAEVLAEAGIEIPLSCEQGICGTCLTPVLAGTPDHRDLVMSDDEHAANDQITPCCSRSKSDVLILDL